MGALPQPCRQAPVPQDLDSLCGCVMLLDIAINEGGEIAGGSSCLICRLCDAESAQQLVERFDGFLVFGFGILCV